jgi:predicted  nucleic acid-binding Zn-ribbon protein
MAQDKAQALALAASALAEAQGKLKEAQKELESVQKRIQKRTGTVAVAQAAYDAAFKDATK